MMARKLRPAPATLLVLLALLLTAGCGPKTPPAATTPAPHAVAPDPLAAPIPLDPSILHGRLDNGLTYYVRRNTRPENRAEIRLVINAGSMQEDDDQRGLAHFVEHMAFNGTEHFDKQELIDYLEGIGMQFGPHINAYTSFDETVYMLMLPTDDPEILEKGFLILEDWARAVKFEDEEIDKERGVVLEEWRLGRGAGARMWDQQFPVLFSGSRYADRLVIGDPEILQGAPPERLRSFYADWYRPSLMAVIAVGDFEPEAVVEKIRAHFEAMPWPPGPRDRVLFPVPDHEETLVSIATDPEATSTQVSVFYKLPARKFRTVADYRRMLVENLYHGMVNARLDEVRQQADPPFLFAFSSSGGFVRTREMVSQSAGVQEGGVERGLEALLVEVERIDRHGFTQDELDRARADMLRAMEQSARESDKTPSARLAAEYARHYLEGEPVPGIATELEYARALLPGVTVEELNDLADEWISEHNRVILVQAPEKEGVVPPAQEALLATFEGMADREIAPYEDQVRQGPLVPDPPAPGAVVSESTVPEIGVTRWKLSNGVQVILKPTDFQNDQLLLRGYSPGGHSLVPDAQWVSAVFAAPLLAASGWGEFSNIELDKALAGKQARVSTGIGETDESVQAAGSPEDAETIFSLVYLAFTAPRRDEQAYLSFRSRIEGFVANRLARPETVFGDDMSAALYQGHLRRRPLSPELLEELDLDAAVTVYRDRFADAGDFTFVIVGNFDLQEIRPLVLTYLGGLPSTGREETWRDTGVRTPEEVVKIEVHRGLEPKSAVRIVFTGDAAWTREASHILRSLGEVLRIRLREVLREDMGGVYGVGVGGSIAREPREEYAFSISFGCAPENVDDLVAAVYDEIHKLQNDGIDQSYIDKVREAQLRDRETDLEENGVWAALLENYDRYSMDPRLILEYEELVAGVTRESIREAARKYLRFDRYVEGRLYPEAEAAAEELPAASGF